MSFFKKLFGSKNNEPKEENNNKSNLESFKQIPWMTDLRFQNVSICLDAGFKPV